MQIIIENGSQLNNTMHCVTSVTLPDSVTIFGSRTNVHVNEVCHGELTPWLPALQIGIPQDTERGCDVENVLFFRLPPNLDSGLTS